MLLAQTPTGFQTPTARLGFVRPGVGRRDTKPEWRMRFGSPEHYEIEPPPNIYTGTLSPFYYAARQWWNDPTLRYQAPRPAASAEAGHPWFDQTLVLQAQRGPDEFGNDFEGVEGAVDDFGEEVKEMSTAAKIAIALGASALIIGGSVLVVKHTIVERGLM